MAAVVVIPQASLHQIPLSEYGNRFGLAVTIIKAEHAVFGWKEDLERHILWVSDVQVAEDAEVSGGQGCDSTLLDQEARVVPSLEVGVLSLHLRQELIIY